MVNRIMEALAQHKMYLVIAVAVMVVLAYAIPYGMDVEAKKGGNPGKHYGITEGNGYGLNCDSHKTGKGPLPCR
jgi:hypothetical protein